MTVHKTCRQLAALEVGARIYFAEEKQPYRIRARSKRYLVCTKPFNPRHTVLYTVVDLHEGVRGTENLVFCFGAETDEHCKAMVNRLEGIDDDPLSPADLAELRKVVPDFTPREERWPTEVSHRNRIPVVVARVIPIPSPAHAQR